MSRRPRSLVIAASVCMCLFIADACNRDLTAPPRTESARRPHAPGTPDLDVASSQDQVTATTTGPSIWTGAEANANPSPIATFPTPTIYKIAASGVITMTPDPRFMPGQPIKTYGPANYASAAWGAGSNNGGVLIGGSSSDSSETVYSLVWGSLYSVSRSGGWGCELECILRRRLFRPVWRLPGPATTFTFTRLNADLTLTADSTNVAPGSTVTLMYGASPTQVEGQTMPVVVDSVRWILTRQGRARKKRNRAFTDTPFPATQRRRAAPPNHRLGNVHTNRVGKRQGDHQIGARPNARPRAQGS